MLRWHGVLRCPGVRRGRQGEPAVRHRTRAARAWVRGRSGWSRRSAGADDDAGGGEPVGGAGVADVGPAGEAGEAGTGGGDRPVGAPRRTTRQARRPPTPSICLTSTFG